MNFSQEHDKKQFLQPTVNAISAMLDLPVSIWLVDEAGKVLRAVAVTETLEELIGNAEIPLDGPSVAAGVFKTLETAVVENIEADENWQFKAGILSLGLRSAVMPPLLIKNREVGLLVVYVPKENPLKLEKLKPKVESAALQIADTLRHVQGLETLNEVGRQLNSQIQNPQFLLKNIIQSAQQVLNCEHVSIFLKDSTSGDLVLEKSSTDQLRRDRFKPGEGLAGVVVQTGESMLVPDALKHPNYVPGLYLTAKKRSMLLSPIKSEGGKDVVGVISADIVGLDGFDSQDMLWLETLTNHAATAIKNTQLYQYVNQRRKAMVDIGKKLTEKIHLSENDVFELIYEQATHKLDVDNFFIALHDEEDDMIHFVLASSEGKRVSVNTEEGWKDRQWLEGHKIEMIISTNEHLLLNTRKEIEERFQDRPEKNLARSWLGVPMHSGEKILGIVATYNYEQDYFFNEDDVEIFQVLADLASVAIENARFYTQCADDIASLQDINEAVVSKDRDEILQLIVRKAVETMPGEYSSLWLIELGTGDLILEAAYGSAGTRAREVKRLKKASATSINLEVAGTGTPHICSDVKLEPRFYRIYEKAKSSVTVPLRYRNSVIGTLNVESSKLNAFTEQHSEMLDSFSDQAAIAIENFRLYTQLQEQRDIQIEAIRQISMSIASPFEIGSILDGVLDWVIKLMGEASLGEIRLLDKETDELVAERFRGEEIDEQYRRTPVGKGITGWVAQYKEPLLIRDVSKNERYLPFLKNMGSEIAVPIIKEDELIGVLNIEHPQINAFTENDVKLAEAIANLTSIAVENTRLYKKLQEQREKRIQAIGEISASIAAVIERKQVLNKILNWTISLIGEKSFGEIRLLDRETNELVAECSVGGIQKDEYARIPVGKGITGWVAQHKQRLLIEDVSEDSRYLPYREGIRTELAVPMLKDEELIGVLNIEHSRIKAFTEDDAKLAEAIATLASVAIENARLYEQIQAQRETQIEAIHEISTSIAAPLELTRVMDGVLDWLIKLLGEASLAEVQFFENETNELVTKHSKGTIRENKHLRIPIDKGITGWVAQNRVPLMVPDVSKNSRYLACVGVTKSELAVPILKGDELIGVLNIEHHIVNAFTDDDVKLAVAIANLVAIAIKNADIYDELDTRVKKRTAELKAAYEISEAGHDAKNFEELYPKIHEIIKKLIPSAEKNFRIGIYNYIKGLFEIPHWKDEYDELLCDELIKKGLTGYVFRTGDSLICSPEMRDELIEKGEIRLLGKPSKSWMGVPLKIDGECIGVIVVQSYYKESKV